MKITKITMTGADDSIKPSALIPISEKHPLVEWGILRSRSQNGGKRFPSQAWVRELAQLDPPRRGMHLSAHLCGRHVREVLEDGHFQWVEDPKEFVTMYERVQLNFHAERHVVHPEFSQIIADQKDYDFIFQMDGTANNERIFHEVIANGGHALPLFDVSGGIGAVPESWPKPFHDIYCGYAGGLGPTTIVEQLKRIEQVVGDRAIWIDMETRIRSENDAVFDLDKVVECIELALPWVG